MTRRSLSAYIQNVDAMFAEVKDQYEEIGKLFIVVALEELVQNTPGPDLQYAGTDYIATGRLRAGWNYSENPPLTTGETFGGPYDTSRGGQLTITRVSGDILSAALPREVALWNEVGYGYYVHYGLENHTHIGPRPWVYDASKLGQEFLAVAMERAGR